jgi:hypothetical protein
VRLAPLLSAHAHKPRGCSRVMPAAFAAGLVALFKAVDMLRHPGSERPLILLSERRFCAMDSQICHAALHFSNH